MRDQWVDSPLLEYSYRIRSDEVKLQRGDCNLNAASGFLKLTVLSVEVSPQRKEQWEVLVPGGTCSSCTQSLLLGTVTQGCIAPLQHKCWHRAK